MNLIKGENGQGTTIDEKSLTKEDKDRFDDGWKKYAFNNYLSTLLPLNRSLPDIRLPGYVIYITMLINDYTHRTNLD